jgi:hypothetical protein
MIVQTQVNCPWRTFSSFIQITSVTPPYPWRRHPQHCFLITAFNILVKTVKSEVPVPRAVLRVRIGFNADPDPAFFISADPDPDPDLGFL